MLTRCVDFFILHSISVLRQVRSATDTRLKQKDFTRRASNDLKTSINHNNRAKYRAQKFFSTGHAHPMSRTLASYCYHLSRSLRLNARNSRGGPKLITRNNSHSRETQEWASDKKVLALLHATFIESCARVEREGENPRWRADKQIVNNRLMYWSKLGIGLSLQNLKISLHKMSRVLIGSRPQAAFGEIAGNVRRRWIKLALTVEV